MPTGYWRQHGGLRTGPPWVPVLFANARATRVKLLVHDGFGVWCATRRLHTGSFVWAAPAAAGVAAALQLTAQQFEALVVGLPWQRLPELRTISRA